MFDGLDYITLYWLSGFGDPKYEIWEAKKATIQRTPDSLECSLYLAWPLEPADEGHIIIRQRAAGLTLETLVPRRRVRPPGLCLPGWPGINAQGRL
jgi:hypothetical protein